MSLSLNTSGIPAKPFRPLRASRMRSVRAGWVFPAGVFVAYYNSSQYIESWCALQSHYVQRDGSYGHSQTTPQVPPTQATERIAPARWNALSATLIATARHCTSSAATRRSSLHSAATVRAQSVSHSIANGTA